MMIKSVLRKFLFFLLIFCSSQIFAQTDSTLYYFGGVQTTLLNSFKSGNFQLGWMNSSEHTNINSIEAGLLFRLNSRKRNWSGFKMQISSTSSDALSRSKSVSYTEQNRTISYTASENLSLKMTEIGYVFIRTFNKNKRSGFLINPNIVIATMHQKFKRDIDSESDSKAIGFELTSGVTWYPVHIACVKALVGYRSLKLKINAFESTGEEINWSGPYIAVGICIAVP
jgi:hypothetical protein